MERTKLGRRLVADRVTSLDGWSDTVAVMSAVLVAGALVIGSYFAQQAGYLFSPEFADNASGRAIALMQTAQSLSTPIGLAGLSGGLLAVVLVLRRIRNTIGVRRDAVVSELPHLYGVERFDAVATAPEAVATTREAEAALLKPGQAAPVTGVYRCDLDRLRVRLVRGRTIPPCPGGSHHRFRLVEEGRS